MILDNGTHIIIDIYDIADKESLKFKTSIENIMDNIADTCKLSVVNKIFHQFQPYGVTGVYVLAESHLSIHTFVDERKIAIDLYTCRKMENTESIISYISSLFGDSCKIKSSVIDRLLDNS